MRLPKYCRGYLRKKRQISVALGLITTLMSCGRTHELSAGSPVSRAPDLLLTADAGNPPELPPAAATHTPIVVVDSLSESVPNRYVSGLGFNGERLISWYTGGDWVLWNSKDAKPVQNGRVGDMYEAHLTDAQLILVGSHSVEVRAADSGNVEAAWSVGDFSKMGLTADGKTLWFVTNEALEFYDSHGTQLGRCLGNYSDAKISGQAGELYAALTPAGLNVIETIQPAHCQRTTSVPFSGQFIAWFKDGSAFFTEYASTVANVYDPKAEHKSVVDLGNNHVRKAEGTGHTLFVKDSRRDLHFYPAAGGPSTLTLPYYDFSATADGVLIFNDATRSAAFVDLRAESPQIGATNRNWPSIRTGLVSAKDGRWVSSGNGLPTDIRDDQGAQFSYEFAFETVRSLRQWSDDTILVGTAVNQVLKYSLYQFDETAAHAAGSLELPVGEELLQVVAHGSLLLTESSQRLGPESTTSYTLSDSTFQSQRHVFSVTDNSNAPFRTRGHARVSEDGRFVYSRTEREHDYHICSSETEDLNSGQAVAWPTSANSFAPQPSPGAKFVVTSDDDGNTKIYSYPNMTLTGVSNMHFLSWINDDEILVQNGQRVQVIGTRGDVLRATALTMPERDTQACYSLETPLTLRVIDQHHVFWQGAIVNLDSGSKVWEGGTFAAPVGLDRVIYQSSGKVLLARWR